jgi:hypothetical protein
MRRTTVLAVLAACSSVPRAPTAEPRAVDRASPVAAGDAVEPDDNPDLLAKRETGWGTATAADRAAIRSSAASYVAYLNRAKTPRRALAGLLAEVDRAGGRPLPGSGAVSGRLYVARVSDQVAVVVRPGRALLQHSVRIVVAPLATASIDIKPYPIFTAAGLALLDTVPQGPVDLPAWLSQPLALYAYAPASRTRPAIDVAIGDNHDDPVLVIPDLLPHLASQVQGKQLVDSPERMNVVSAGDRAALIAALEGHGVPAAELSAIQMSVVPAELAQMLGIDQALIAGHGSGDLALAYSAVRGLIDAPGAEHTAVVVLAAVPLSAWSADAATGAVQAAMSQLQRALAPQAADALTTRRLYATSAALIAAAIDGTPSRGITLDPHATDALPAALRRATSSFDRSGAQWQLGTVARAARPPGRELGTLDLDAVELGVPVWGRGRPLQIISTFDLYQAYRACRGWLSGT